MAAVARHRRDGRPACPGHPACRGHPAGPHPDVSPAYARTLTVTRLANAGPGSLRAAIDTANTSLPGRPTIIRFSVRGVIKPLASALPAISAAVIIDGGTSAPRHVRGRPPVVEVNCRGPGGLRFAVGSAGSQLLGLAVDNARGAGVTLAASGGSPLNGATSGLTWQGQPHGNRGRRGLCRGGGRRGT